MREILFRGKRMYPLINEWIYGHVRTYKKNGLLGASILKDNVEDVLIYIETLGQYTGIDDKNGVRVFEADILKVKDSLPGGEMEFMGVVEFKDGSFVIVNDEMTHYRWIDYEIEVIGNKFDNPELLEDNR